MLDARLKVLGGKHQGKEIPLPPGRFLIGRERDCHLRPASDLVSRHHCVFYIDDYVVRLRDLGSLNGTLINDERLQGETTLQDGDRVKIGGLELELALREVTPEEPAAVTPPTGQVIGDTALLSSSETAYELQQPLQESPTPLPGQAPPPPHYYPQPAYPPGYGMPPGYGPPPGYGMPPGYGPPPSYGPPPGYGPPQGYGPPPGYGQPQTPNGQRKVEPPPVRLPPPPERV